MSGILFFWLLLLSFPAFAQEESHQEESEADAQVTFEADYPEDANYTLLNTQDEESLLYGLFQGLRRENTGGGVYSNYMDYNLYLWEASLETASAFPVDQIDSTSGVILTQWYSDPENSDIRTKVDIYVLGETMRPTSLEVSVFKESKNSDGKWSGIMERVKSQSINLKLLILKRARLLASRDIITLENE